MRRLWPEPPEAVFPEPAVGVVFVYALTNPLDDRVRYVGVTSTPRKRYREHIWRGRQTHTARWIAKLLRGGRVPGFTILERSTDAKWAEAERRWIAHFRGLMPDLTNIVDGGERTVGFRHSEESRAKMRAWKRPPCSDELRAYFSQRFKGRPGRPWSDDERKRWGDRQRGKRIPPEQAARAAESLRRWRIQERSERALLGKGALTVAQIHAIWEAHERDVPTATLARNLSLSRDRVRAVLRGDPVPVVPCERLPGVYQLRILA